MRQFTAGVKKIQEAVAEALRGPRSFEVFMERALLPELGAWMTEHGHPADKVTLALNLLGKNWTRTMKAAGEAFATKFPLGLAAPEVFEKAEAPVEVVIVSEPEASDTGAQEERGPQGDVEMAPTEKGDTDLMGFEELEEDPEKRAPAGGFLAGEGPPRTPRGSGAHGDRAPGEAFKYFVIFEPGRYRGRLHLRDGCTWGRSKKVRDGEGYDSPLEEVPYTSTCVRCFPEAQSSDSESSV